MLDAKRPSANFARLFVASGAVPCGDWPQKRRGDVLRQSSDLSIVLLRQAVQHSGFAA